MGIKIRLRKLAHPTLLILVLGALYAFTVGGYPQGGPTEADLQWDVHALESDNLPNEQFVVAALPYTAGAEMEQQSSEPLPIGVEPAPEQATSAVAFIPTTPNVGGPSAQDVRVTEAPPTPQVHSHTVRLGETLSDIARAYNIDVDTIIAANNIPDPNRIRSGDKLSVPNVKGVLHEVKRGESLWNIASLYEVSMDEIVAANSLNNPNSLQVGQQLIVPGAQALVSLRKSEALVSASGQLLRNFSWPATGRISSRFGPRWGRMHNGLDLAINTGTPVRAAAAGRVTFSGDNGGYGLLIKIDHGNGIETRYAHNSRLVARVGQRVARGDLIAYSGNTGNSTGPHLHFEIRRNGVALDPLDFLR